MAEAECTGCLFFLPPIVAFLEVVSKSYMHSTCCQRLQLLVHMALGRLSADTRALICDSPQTPRDFRIVVSESW